MIKYLLLLTVFPLTMNAQETPNPQFTKENNNVDNWTRSIYGSVGLITYTDRQSGSTHIGTGTLIAKPFITEGEREAVKFYLVTNKHVLPQANAASEITFKISAPWQTGTDKFIDVPIPIYDNATLYSYIKINANGEDVAVIDFTSFFIRNKLDSIGDDIMPFAMLATKTIIEERNLSIGDPVYFIGYPSFFYNSRNASPLLRGGYIATDPKEAYYFSPELKQLFKRDELNGFLIDANTFGGSSGSLVILKSQYSQMYNGDIVHSLQKAVPYILGIVAESYPSINQNDNLQKLAIGGVISSEVIIETINQFQVE